MKAGDFNKTGEVCAAALETVIEHGSDAPHQEISDAVRCVIDLRNHLLQGFLEGRVKQARLDEANALVSLAHGAEHPLIGFHLHRLEQTRDGVRQLLSKI